MAGETVTVSMNRSDLGTPWGFRLQGGKEFGAPLSVSRITAGSVAENAGLREGDLLLTIAGQHADNLRHKEAQDAILSSGNNLEIVIERGSIRIWKPLVQSVPVAPGDSSTAPVKISLAHDHRQTAVCSRTSVQQPRMNTSRLFNRCLTEQAGSGHNAAAKPFGSATVPNNTNVTATPSNPTVTTDLQYNSPAALYSKQSAVDAYLQQTGGLFGTDPKLNQQKPEPAYLKSATLKLIHEAEKGAPSQPSPVARPQSQEPSHYAQSGPPPPGAPICDSCGRTILNVFCKAGEKNLHPDCFKCSTCGTHLKNKGYFLVHEKLYCDIHAKQQTENQFKATPPVDPNVFAGRAPPPPAPTKNSDPIRAFYQPDIMKRGNIVHPPKATNISPHSRGVPTHFGDYKSLYTLAPGDDFNLRGTSPSAQLNLPPSTAPFSTAAPHLLNSAPLASKNVNKFHWPPKASAESHSHVWKVPNDLTSRDNRAPVTEDYERLITYNISQYTRDKRTPSPKRHVLTEDIPRQQEWKLERQDIESQRRPGILEQFGQLEKMLDTKLEVTSGEYSETFEHVILAPRITTSITFEQTGPKLAGKNLHNGKEERWTTMEIHQSSGKQPQEQIFNQKTSGSNLDNVSVPPKKPALKTILKKDTSSTVSEIKSSTVLEQQQQQQQQYEQQQEQQEDIKERSRDGIVDDVLQNMDNFELSEDSSYPPWRNPKSSQGASSMVTTGGFSSTSGQMAGATAAPKRGRGILKQLYDGPRVPFCNSCHVDIRGPFVLALGKTWCPDHFVCSTGSCQRKLLDVGFVEENGQIYCEHCFEKYFAPLCTKCSRPVTGDCLTALEHQWHPECFTCVQCHKPFGNSSFFVENGQPICENDWNTSYTTKCVNCQFAIEAGDRWVEALGSPYHSDCFCCTICQKNLEGQSFYAKGSKPYCKAHA